MYNAEYSMNIKKSIFRYSIYVGASMLISVGAQFLFSLIATAILSIIGYSPSEMQQILTDTWSGYLINSIALALICTVPFLILKNINNQPFYEVCCFNSPKKKLTLPCVIFALGFAMLANVFTSIFVTALENFFGFEAVQATIGDNSFSSPVELIYILLCSALVPALFEELAFRGMVMGSLRKFGDMPAVFVSALIFALYHGNFIQIPFAFLVGIALGIVVVMTDSIWPAIIAHFLNNTYAVVVNSISRDNMMFVSKLFLLIILLGIIALAFLVKRNAFLNIKKGVLGLSGSSKFFRMVASPTMIIYFIIMIFMALMSRA